MPFSEEDKLYYDKKCEACLKTLQSFDSTDLEMLDAAMSLDFISDQMGLSDEEFGDYLKSIHFEAEYILEGFLEHAANWSQEKIQGLTKQRYENMERDTAKLKAENDKKSLQINSTLVATLNSLHGTTEKIISQEIPKPDSVKNIFILAAVNVHLIQHNKNLKEKNLTAYFHAASTVSVSCDVLNRVHNVSDEAINETLKITRTDLKNLQDDLNNISEEEIINAALDIIGPNQS